MNYTYEMHNQTNSDNNYRTIIIIVRVPGKWQKIVMKQTDKPNESKNLLWGKYEYYFFPQSTSFMYWIKIQDGRSLPHQSK